MITSAPSACWTACCWALVLLSSCGQSHEQLMTTGLSGHNVTLQCRAPTGGAVRAAEWSRPDLEPQYVFFYRNKQSDATNQHPSFAGRVELLDGQLKGGDLSIVLENLRRSDSGTYKCRVKQGAAVRPRRAVIRTEPICSIQLTVSESRQEAAGLNASGENLVGRVGLLAGVLLLVVGGI